MKNYQKMSVAQDARVELHDSLALTGWRKDRIAGWGLAPYCSGWKTSDFCCI